MQTASYEIWTQIANSILYDKHHAMYTFSFDFI